MSKGHFYSSIGYLATSIFIPCKALLLLMKMINTNCVQCLYHWYRPLELMIQMTSGVYCSADGGLSLHKYGSP